MKLSFMNNKDKEKMFLVFLCTVYGGSEDAVDYPKVEDNEVRRDIVAGPQTSVEH